MPAQPRATTAVIVASVVSPNTAVTNATSHMCPFAAGYISIGINGSQGPNRKIVNNTHGVTAASSLGLSAPVSA